jgi:glycosyltransferase involved in cell wall biosynthesis
VDAATAAISGTIELMSMPVPEQRIAILHYSAAPIVGGVESVMNAHTQLLIRHGYQVTVVAGRGKKSALPAGAEFVSIPLLDSQHEAIMAASQQLEQGTVPDDFEHLVAEIVASLVPVLQQIDTLIVHNVFTKHFNLPLTAALFQLIDDGVIQHCVAWSHDFTWTSPNSRSKVFAGYPWDLLRTFREDVVQVVVSGERREQLAGLYQCPLEAIHVVYNGVDAAELLSLTPTAQELVARLSLFSADLIMLMPVRVTQAKNIEFALEVVAALKAEGVAVKLIYTGPPDPHDAQSMAYFRSLQAQRHELDLDDNFHFVFESGPDPDEPFLIDMDVVGDLFRVADLLFMPSHREGFGMPVLEAGLAGLPVVVSNAVPAAVEIGGKEVFKFDLDISPEKLAGEIIEQFVDDSRLLLARRVRRRYTWDAIFRIDMEPLLQGGQSV